MATIYRLGCGLVLMGLLTGCPTDQACSAGACSDSACGGTILADGASCPACSETQGDASADVGVDGADVVAPDGGAELTPDNGPDAPPVEYCSAWGEAADLTAAAVVSLNRFALDRSEAIVEGRVGEQVLSQEHLYVTLEVDRVHYGWRFLEGLTVLVPLVAERASELVAGERWIFGLSSSRPSLWEPNDLPSWGNVMTMFPSSDSETYADQLEYRVGDATHVAVVILIEHDQERATFQVLDALKGTLPETFHENWYASWDLPYPAVSSSELHPELSTYQPWIVSLRTLTDYPDAGVVLGSIADMRPADEADIVEVKAALASPELRYDRQALRRQRDQLHTGLRFHSAPLVVGSLVTGLAEECCTGAGGTFVSHEVNEVVKGALDSPRFVTGGHAYYGEETCGDGYLHAMDGLTDASDLPEEDFDCLMYPAWDSWDAEEWGISSPVIARVPWTSENEARVRSWVQASSPVLRLFDPEADVSKDELAQDPANAPWSLPMDATEAFLAATHQILLVVKGTAHHEASGLHEVFFTTTYSMHEYDHLTVYDVKLIFECADPRLFEVQSRWIAPLVLLEGFSYYPDEGPSLERSFIVPGVLIPEKDITPQLASKLAHFLN